MVISTLKRGLFRFGLRIKEFIFLILKHNIFFHSSAISYYAALSIAPFLLILLQVAALLGHKVQAELTSQTYFILGPEVGRITEMIFNNAVEGISLASISGVIGGVTLLFTASFVFMQLRFSFDMIFGYYDPDSSRSFKEIVKERMLSMLFVVAIAVLFLLSLFVSNIVKYVAGTDMNDTVFGQILSNLLSFLINLMMFSALYYFAPSKTPKIKTAVEAAIFTSVAFVFGKILIGLYFKNIAINSVYGATGTLLVFLIWAYYSSFTLFLSLEGFLFLHPENRQIKT